MLTRMRVHSPCMDCGLCTMQYLTIICIVTSYICAYKMCNAGKQSLYNSFLLLALSINHSECFQVQNLELAMIYHQNDYLLLTNHSLQHTYNDWLQGVVHGLCSTSYHMCT